MWKTKYLMLGGHGKKLETVKFKYTDSQDFKD